MLKSTAAMACIALYGLTAMAHAEELVPAKEEKKNDVRARGSVDWSATNEFGEEFIVLKVNVCTRTKGRGRTGRGHAIFTVYRKDNPLQPWFTLDAKKYASTGTNTEKEKCHSTERSFQKSDFLANYGGKELVVKAEDKGGVPNNTDQLGQWLKDVAGPELRKARDEVLNSSGDTSKKEGANWIVEKGNLPF